MKSVKTKKIETKKETKKTIKVAEGERDKMRAFLVVFKTMIKDLTPEAQLALICLLETENIDLWKKKIEFFKD